MCKNPLQNDAALFLQGESPAYKSHARVIRPDTDPAHSGVHSRVDEDRLPDSFAGLRQLFQHIRAEDRRTDLQPGKF